MAAFLLIIVGIWSLFLSSPQVCGAEHQNNPRFSEKTLVMDGHVRHDIGALQNHVDNFGLIGSAPSIPTSFSDAPSGRWPGAQGTDFLWAGGLWVGGLIDEEPLVSTGGWNSVFYGSEAPADTIYPVSAMVPGGGRFPWPNADDDQDGLENEDPRNGLDDDGDGLVDEDFAGIGEQAYRCVMRDDTDLAQQNQPDHIPLGLSVTQESYQWDLPLLTNAIAYEFTITNVGPAQVDEVYLGMFGDFDVEDAQDDRAGFWQGLVTASDGNYYKVSVAYTYDDAANNPVAGLEGWVLLGHTTDSAGVEAPAEVGIHAYRDWWGNASFAQGGDPTNDAERYEVMSTNVVDPPSLHPDDHRILISSGPFLSLAPGASLKYQVALVAGENLAELRDNAAEMVACYQGRVFDRDGQPERVHWIPLAEEIVASGMGSLQARVVELGVEIGIETNLSAADGLQLVRHGSATLAERTWTPDQFSRQETQAGRTRYTVLDTDVGGGPRQYELSLEQAGSVLPLDQLQTDGPLPPVLSLVASPNPFNPRLEIQFTSPAPARVLIQAFDLRGHLVRTLLDEPRSAGAGQVFWDGRDDQGLAAASGVYQLKLLTAGQLVQQRVTLVR